MRDNPWRGVSTRMTHIFHVIRSPCGICITLPFMTDDQVLQDIWKRGPLIHFSVYSHLQVEALRRLSSEICEHLDTSISAQGIDGAGFQRTYGLFWLWVLGAYEMTRTLSEYKKCFSDLFQGEIAHFKSTISVLRMPFAKQQFQGRDKRPISAEASIYGVDTTNKDLSFQIDGKEIWVRVTLAEFERFMGAVTVDDVLSDLRDAGE